MCAYSLDHITQKTLGGVQRYRVPFVLTAPLLSCRSEDRPCHATYANATLEMYPQHRKILRHGPTQDIKNLFRIVKEQ
jgi:hypothetical protein